MGRAKEDGEGIVERWGSSGVEGEGEESREQGGGEVEAGA